MTDSSAHPPAAPLESDMWNNGSGTPSVWPQMLGVLWSYRRRALLASMVSLVLCVLGLLIASLALPSDRIGILGFRLVFEGAASGAYPNGLKFNPAEIVSGSILSDVYKANDLSRYGSFEDFKAQFFVLQAGQAIELLDYEYQTKLADSRLTPVDRARLEDEYRKKREALASPEYAVNLRRTDLFKAMPQPMIAKVLHDVLSTWAEQAVARKGVLKYDIPVVSHNALTLDAIKNADFIIGADMLRSQAQRLGRSISAIGALPGAALFRSKSGGLTLAELDARIQSVIRFKVQPLMEVIRSTGMTRDPLAIDLYFKSQLMLAKLRQAEAQQRVRAFEDPLRSYLGTAEAGGAGTSERAPRGAAPFEPTAIAPQLTETFLQQLVAMSRRAEDLTFRQDVTKKMIEASLALTDTEGEVAFYEGMQGAAGRWSAQTPGHDDLIRWATARSSETLTAINEVADQVLEVYEEVSARNLSSGVELFVVTSPFRLESHPALPLKRAWLILFSAILAIILIVPSACLLHYYAARGIRRAGGGMAAQTGR